MNHLPRMHAELRPAWRYDAWIDRVHDGDTVTARIDLGFDVQVQARLRLVECFARELRETGGDEARDYLAHLLDSYALERGGEKPLAGPWRVVVETVKWSTGRERKTLDRYLARVWGAGVDGAPVCLNQKMVGDGYATTSAR